MKHNYSDVLEEINHLAYNLKRNAVYSRIVTIWKIERYTVVCRCITKKNVNCKCKLKKLATSPYTDITSIYRVTFFFLPSLHVKHESFKSHRIIHLYHTLQIDKYQQKILFFFLLFFFFSNVNKYIIRLRPKTS